jgi:hypothetical protein
LSIFGLFILFIRTFLIPFVGYMYIKRGSDINFLKNTILKNTITNIDFFTWSGLFLTYLFKYLRTLYVFNQPIKHYRKLEKIMDKLFKSEIYLITLVVILALIYTIVCYFFLNSYVFSWVDDPFCFKSHTTPTPRDYVFWVLDIFIKIILLALIYFIAVSLRIPSVYLIKYEIICLVIYYYIFTSE